MKTKREAPSWFTEALKEAEKKAGGTRAALARKLRVPPQTIMGWETGAVPGLDLAEAVVKLAGGNLAYNKKSPDKEPKIVYEIHDADAINYERPPQNSIFIWGQVAAGRVTYAGEDQHFKTVDSLWAGSRYWGLTTGPIAYVEVHGESMCPQYKPGEVLACRQPADWQNLPNGTPCIFQEGHEDELTFKFLHQTDTGDIVGQPCNQDYPMVVFKKKSVRIQLVVLGKVQLEKKSIADGVIEAKSKKKNTKL